MGLKLRGAIDFGREVINRDQPHAALYEPQRAVRTERDKVCLKSRLVPQERVARLEKDTLGVGGQMCGLLVASR